MISLAGFADNVLDIFEQGVEEHYTLLQMYVVFCKYYPEVNYTKESYINEN